MIQVRGCRGDARIFTNGFVHRRIKERRIPEDGSFCVWVFLRSLPSSSFVFLIFKCCKPTG